MRLIMINTVLVCIEKPGSTMSQQIFNILIITHNAPWFPLTASYSTLGEDFVFVRAFHSGCIKVEGESWGGAPYAGRDLAAIRHLDEVRIADLTQSRENLSTPVNQFGLQ